MRSLSRQHPDPSFPNAWKSKYYVEAHSWDAAIKVDYDADRNPFTLRRLRLTALWLQRVGVVVTRVVVATTRKGWHLRAWTARPLGPYRALRTQTMLGDDPFRQQFNLRRVRNKESGWQVLWTEKWRNGQLIMQEKLSLLTTVRSQRIFSTVHDRFWAKVSVRGENDCWMWTASTVASRGGAKYGKFCPYKGSFVLSHRYAFTITHGEPKHQVLHTCDNALCCNPNHLEDGTQQKNIRDAKARKRLRPARGERSGKAKLTIAAVRRIRRWRRQHQWSHARIASELDLSVTAQAVRHVLSGRTWSHVI